jgi:hypothetical protein
MITKIKKVKNLGIFSNYVWDNDLSDFGRFNVIYGWNGTGKTTLSKLFECIEKGEHLEYLDLEYEIECGVDSFKHKEIFDKKVRVFNESYVLNNVKILEAQTNSISLILGEENKELLQQIKNDEITLYGDPENPTNVGKVKLLNKIEKEKIDWTKRREEQFTSIARTIGASIGGEAVRSYTSKQAKPAFNLITGKNILSDDLFAKHSTTLKQKEEPKIDKLVIPPIIINGQPERNLLNLLNETVGEAKLLLQKTVKVTKRE